MQGIAVIRWTISCTVALALHLGGLFWSGKILPPASATSSRNLAINSNDQRSVSLATVSFQNPSSSPIEQRATLHPAIVPDTKLDVPVTNSTEQPQPIIEIKEQSKTISPEELALTELLPKTETPSEEKIAQDNPPTPPKVVRVKAVIPPKPKPKPKVPLKVAAQGTPIKTPGKPHLPTKSDNTTKSSAPPEVTPPPSPTAPVTTKPTKKHTQIQQANIATAGEVQNKTKSQSSSLNEQGLNQAGQGQKRLSNNQIASLTYNDLPLLTQPSFSRPPRPPEYPQRAKRKKLQGNVVLRAKIDRSGIVQEIHIWRSSGHRLLDKAAQKAMREWRFIPARQGGITTASWVEFPIDFSIR
ncbi:hypothetical protein WH96_17410 [Kiloniella spongiae]|uniref:TonB C-terminal domain-containing protein n=1 Tax=Kiloniella spongiae TaxID=1489064 RepID=A0A0H2MB90_9PROT|nr:hypothetical protein WH96_17410 [Kiloniella spongiae]